MANCQFVAFHGWALDAHFWESWSDSLSKFGIFHAYDRGYFNSSQAIRISDSGGPLVVITHSLGLHLVDKELLEKVDMLVVTSGFLYFHPYAAQYKRRSRLIVQEMLNDLEIHPEKVLERYYQDCFAPSTLPEINFGEVNHQLLIDDLELLQDAEMDIELMKNAEKVCILHGSKDRIVPYKKGRQIYNQLQEQAQYFEIKDAGHAMPKTHHRQCLDFIIPELKQLIKVRS